MRPSEWFAAVLDTLRHQNKDLPFKIVSTQLGARDVFRVLNTSDGSVWVFEMYVERGPV